MHLLKPRPGAQRPKRLWQKKGGGWLKVCSVFLLLLQRHILPSTTLRPKRLGYTGTLLATLFARMRFRIPTRCLSWPTPPTFHTFKHKDIPILYHSIISARLAAFWRCSWTDVTLLSVRCSFKAFALIRPTNKW